MRSVGRYVGISFFPILALAVLLWSEQGAGGAQGTASGVCESFADVPDAFEPAPGEQTWHFVLTRPGGAVWTLDASFDDGTTVDNLASVPSKANVRNWYVITDQDAKLQSASASTSETGVGGNLVVSNCDVGGPTPTPTPTETPTPTPSPTPSPAPLTIVEVSGF
jgi:hypothetical protein